MRVHRQALVLHRYYEILGKAIVSNHNSGVHYLVTNLGEQAGKILGEESVAVSTVRYWHRDYVIGEGVLRPDERGHHTRELLILEEDVKTKFTKWSLKQAKADDLNVELAQEFLNNELLVTLEESMQPRTVSLRKMLSRAHVFARSRELYRSTR